MTDWLDAVAARSGSDVAAVRDTLERFRIRASREAGKPHTLQVTRVAFSGERPGDNGGTAVPIAFDWRLGPGVWCLASEDNLVGKTTVLEIIRFGLRGRADLQADVQEWLREAEVEGLVDDEPFTVHVRFEHGHPSGELVTGAEQTVVGSFQSREAAAELLAEFMSSRLGLEPLPYWSKEKGAGSERAMSWLVYSSALYIKHLDFLIGEPERGWGGAAGKMLELFVGVPWTSTLAAAQVAVQYQEQRLGAIRRRRKLEQQVAVGSLAALERELAESREQLEATPSDTAQLSALDSALEELRRLDARIVELRRRASVLDEQRRAARQVELEDSRRLRDLTETARAAAFFATLEPTMCPRCETAVTPDRREHELTVHACAVCGSDLGEREEDPTVVQALERSVEDAKKLQSDVAVERAKIGDELSELVNRRAVLRARTDRQAAETQTLQRRRDLELKVARLEGALAERRAIADAVLPEDDVDAEEHDLTLLKAAAAEAEKRLREAEGDLFADVNDEIVRLGCRFGMDALERVELDRAAHLKVWKGGTQTRYSRLTDGEKLRLKIAVALAMLRVGEQRDIGRFPGLLLLDSPGQQETVGEDVVSMLTELQVIAREFPSLEIIAASAQAPLVRSALPPDRVREVAKGERLW